MKKKAFYILFLIADAFAFTLYYGQQKYQLVDKIFAWVKNITTPKSNVIDPVTPVNPIDPDDPIVPITPDDPVDEIVYPYTITFNGNGGITKNNESQVVVTINSKDDTYSIPSFEKELHKQSGWSKTLVNITSDTIVYANWTYDPYFYNTYSVNNFARNNQGVYIKTVGNEIDSFSTILSSISYKENYCNLKLFDSTMSQLDDSNVSLNEGNNTFYVTINTNSNPRVVETLEFNIYRTHLYTVTVNVVGDGLTVDSPIQVLENGSISNILNGKIEKGYQYTSTYDLSNPVTDNLNITITYSPITYNLTFHNVDSYSGSTSYTINDTFDFEVVSKVGYTFDGWFLTSSLNNKIQGISQGNTGDKDIYAKFTPISYSLTYNYNGGFVSKTNKSTYTYNSVLSLSSPIKDGYIFDGYELYIGESLTPVNYVSGMSLPYTESINVVAKYLPIIDSSKVIGDIIELGEYPQSVVTNQSLITALSSSKVASDGYYHVGNEKYAKVNASPFTHDLVFTDGTSQVLNKTYYFKVEPVKWKIISIEDNKYTLAIETILDVNQYSNTIENSITRDNLKQEIIVYPNNYEYSYIKQSVLDSSMLTKLYSNEIINSSNGLDLLSREDLTAYSLDKEIKVSDYAIAKGAMFDLENFNAMYYYKDSYDQSNNMVYYYSPITSNDELMLVTNKLGIRMTSVIISGDSNEE